MDLIREIDDLADELCDPHQHTELISAGWTKSRNKAKPIRHTVVLPGLIQQLYETALDPSAALLEGGTHAKQKSRPPLAVEALSAHQDICSGAERWVSSIRIPLRKTVESNIRALVGVVPKFDLDTLEALLGEMRQWRRWAALMTGWDKPPLRSRIPCPECESRNAIWINLDRMLAVCRECQAYWEGEQIADLATLVGAVAA